MYLPKIKAGDKVKLIRSINNDNQFNFLLDLGIINGKINERASIMQCLRNITNDRFIELMRIGLEKDEKANCNAHDYKLLNSLVKLKDNINCKGHISSRSSIFNFMITNSLSVSEVILSKEKLIQAYLSEKGSSTSNENLNYAIQQDEILRTSLSDLSFKPRAEEKNDFVEWRLP